MFWVVQLLYKVSYIYEIYDMQIFSQIMSSFTLLIVNFCQVMSDSDALKL
jgi:hypothetical protein